MGGFFGRPKFVDHLTNFPCLKKKNVKLFFSPEGEEKLVDFPPTISLLLMVQKSGSPVEVGRLSHALQVFIHPTWWSPEVFHMNFQLPNLRAYSWIGRNSPKKEAFQGLWLLLLGTWRPQELCFAFWKGIPGSFSPLCCVISYSKDQRMQM